MLSRFISYISSERDSRIRPLDHKLWFVRIPIAAMFMESGLDKLLDLQTSITDVASHGVPFPQLATCAAALIEMVGSAALLSGVAMTPALIALAGYTLVVNVFYFDFWAQPMPQAIMARKEFLKNLAVAGGLLAYMIDDVTSGTWRR